MSTLDLFARGAGAGASLGPGITLLRGFADSARLMPLVERVAESSPFRHLVTPGGQTMSVAMTNCGPVGWVSERSGYRYDARDPLTGRAWPPMPGEFLELALSAAALGGFRDFAPDACLVNRYSPGSRLTAHRDADEQNYAQPIVSVSMGLPASFAFYGLTRGGKGRTVPLADGDVLVWGGPSRLVYHAVRPLKPGVHRVTGGFRYNLTFRHAR
ncbi:MAG TPA: DNA oxidative demethylase AlkB [Steroidobacteraceae bacterium]|jgi:alkylated DNA repair protein (DNA oxidative demethylase)|nr:DNA oxidative demethylase AlkB [Steroidobacteraceae bacterium]